MQDQPVGGHESGAVRLTRLFWIFAGNALLVILTELLIKNRPEGFSFLDAGCLFVVVSLVCALYVDIHFLNKRTVEGVPATLTHCGDIPRFACL